MTAASEPQRNAVVSKIDVKEAMAKIEKAQQLAGHFPDAEALDRARRVLTGQTSPAEAHAELDARYRQS